MNEDIIRELQKVCEPVIQYLINHHNPHTNVVVSLDSIKLIQTEISIPTNIK